MRIAILTLVLAACGPGQEPPTTPSPPAPSAPSIGMGELLPLRLLGRDRESLDVQRDSALGAQIETASARYDDVTVTVTDFGSAEMAEMMGHGWANLPTAERIAGQPGQRESLGGAASVRVLIGQRVLVEAAAATDARASEAMDALDLSAFR